jgi:DNA-binding CsgD family transcriptional regulator
MKEKRSQPKSRRVDADPHDVLSGVWRERFGLSRMEAVVACGLADGLTYDEIADRCCISYHTVHSHVGAIHRKVGVSSNARLLALIRKEGWG